MCQVCCDIFYCNRCFIDWQRTKHIPDFICETCWDEEDFESDFCDCEYDEDYDEEEADDFMPDDNFVMAYLANLRDGMR